MAGLLAIKKPAWFPSRFVLVTVLVFGRYSKPFSFFQAKSSVSTPWGFAHGEIFEFMINKTNGQKSRMKHG